MRANLTIEEYNDLITAYGLVKVETSLFHGTEYAGSVSTRKIPAIQGGGTVMEVDILKKFIPESNLHHFQQ